MNFDLVILEGPEAGRRIPVPSVPVTLGRAPAAAMAFPDDGFISSVHLSIQSDARGVRITDLRSTNGTFLNGERVTSAVADIGDVVQIGTMTMQVAASLDKPVTFAAPAPSPFVTEAEKPMDATVFGSPVLPRMEIPAPPPAPPSIVATTTIPRISVDGSEKFRRLDALPVEAPKPHVAVRKRIAAATGPLFMMVNVAADDAITGILAREDIDASRHSLWQNDPAGASMWAPYLIEITADAPLLQTLLERGWRKNWVTVFASPAGTPELIAHFSKFLKVQMEQTGSIYFRFYEPETFRTFLSSGSPAETTMFFGPVREWFLEGDSDSTLLQATNSPDGVKVQSVSLLDG